MRQAVIIDGVRTPIGRAHAEKGIFRDVRADDLSADMLRALLERTKVPADAIEDVHWGCVKQQEEQGYDIARMAALIAGMPIEVGGVEHMHHIPMEAGFNPSPRFFYRHSPATLNMGVTAENLAIKYKISRKEQDEFALRSHRRAAEATDTGAFSKEVIPTWGRDEEGRRNLLTQDQCIRRDTSLEALGALKPSFMPDGGTVTAGNASPLNVGAAATLIMSEDKANELGLKPIAKIRAMAVAGVDPSVMGIGPVPATHKALERAGLKLEDMHLIEINEAFAAQALAVIKVLKAAPEKVNVRGGAIPIGHPLGASGARISC